MVSDLANRVYFRYWNENYIKDVSNIKEASIVCLEFMRADRIANVDDHEDVDVAIEEITNLYKI